jgi:hypothetical protein
MNIESAKTLREGDEIVLDNGLFCTIVTSGIPITWKRDAILFEVQNRFDGTFNVTNEEIDTIN